MPDHLPPCERALVETCGLGSNALVAGNHYLVKTHGLELGEGLDGVLLGVIQALPPHLVGKLGAHLRAAHELLDLIAVLAVLLCQSLAALGLVLVLGLNEPLLQIAVKAVLEALGDVNERGGIEERSQGLKMILLHVCHAEVAMTRHLAHNTLWILRWAGLAAEKRHQSRLAAAISAADGHPGVQAELHRAILDKVVLVLGIAEAQVLGL
mmetsp:Transcript_20215/g.30370  ORF Transcript_20215/g.30370 Transcript_20215/m.30370 type:complete len:210 (-) Transcript_20215:359-988(-)